jgi:hypothetical protein
VLLGHLAPTVIEQIRLHVVYVFGKFFEFWPPLALEIDFW